jgi:glycosyltransferase involved in cell wall biosynthesis
MNTNKMKIAFILSHGALAPTNGIVSQAKTWKNGLESLGHEVILIDMWRKNDWVSFNIIHFFGFNIFLCDFIAGLSKMNSNIVVSPILDPDYSVSRLKLYSRWGYRKLNLTNQYHGLFGIKDKIKLFFVRSEFEKNYMMKGFGIKSGGCAVVPLSYGITPFDETVIKEPFCLHISLLTDNRKNVERLIQAAIKYKFKLILGGKLRNEQEVRLLDSWIGDNSNIEYHGYLTKEEMISLYSRAKVFALPSTIEGVGIVALEAAAMGCDIVMTNLGGPKEYYNGMAEIVNPYNVDEIGKAVMNFLNGNTFQPELKKHILNHLSLQTISQELVKRYKSVLK